MQPSSFFVAAGRFCAVSRNLFPFTGRIPMRFPTAKGQIGRFRTNSSFLFPFSPFLYSRFEQEREQKSGKVVKAPTWHDKRQGSQSFPAFQREQILEIKPKTPSAALLCSPAVFLSTTQKQVCCGQVLPEANRLRRRVSPRSAAPRLRPRFDGAQSGVRLAARRNRQSRRS